MLLLRIEALQMHPQTPEQYLGSRVLANLHPMSVEWNVADVDFWGVDTCQLPRTAPDATLMCDVGRRIEKTQYHVERQYSYDNTLQIQPCVSVGYVTNSWADL